MKALYLTQYGSPLDGEFRNIPTSTPLKSQVKIKVAYVAVNDYDWCMATGNPKAYRLFFGIFKPKRQRPGMECSGTVLEVGPDVKNLKPGDQVYGDTSDHGFGCFAEELVLDEKAFIVLPKGISLAEGAAISHAGNLAYQALVGLGKLRKGNKVLINGGGGGVGTLGLQIAKSWGAHVIGVDTGEKLEKMKTLGFDDALDYRNTDIRSLNEEFDLILDAKTSFGPWAYPRLLRKGGRYVSIGGEPGKHLRLVMMKGLVKRITDKSLHILALKANASAHPLHALMAEGNLKAVIDGPYTFQQSREAIQRFGEGKHFGKILVKISS